MRILIFIICIFAPQLLFCQPIVIQTSSDYQKLDMFFREMIEEESFGYVLENNKPLSALNIYPLKHPPYPDTRYFKWGVLFNEAKEVWERLAPEQKDFIFKITKSTRFNDEYHEILFINRRVLSQVVEENLDLFRFHLGPTLKSEQIVQLIIESPKTLDHLLKSNDTLMGILLGYGTYNSLMGGRLEDITHAHNIHDYPLFAGNMSCLPANQEYLLACTNLESNLSGIAHKLSLQPCTVFNSFNDEIAKIHSSQEKVPEELTSQNPTFIFGAYKNQDNSKLFEAISTSQKAIQKLLERKDLLVYVLECITGEKPTILCDKSIDVKTSNLQNQTSAIAHNLWYMSQFLDEEARLVFIEAIIQHNSFKQRPQKFMLPGALSGLKLAQKNLSRAEKCILDWSKQENIEEIVPEKLYAQTLSKGVGCPIKDATELCLSYSIEDSEENILTANHRCWIDLSTTIPGFAHGVKNMAIGEKRILYVHPSLGYGAFTSLPPCVALKITVTLHEANLHESKHLPDLKAVDLSWVKEPDRLKNLKDLTVENAQYLGKMWGDWLVHSEEINFSDLCTSLKEKLEKPEPISTKSTHDLSNTVYWDLFSKKH